MKPEPPSPVVWVAAGYGVLFVSAAIGIAPPDGSAISFGKIVHSGGVVLHVMLVVAGVVLAVRDLCHRRKFVQSILAILLAGPMVFYLWPAAIRDIL